MAETLTHRMATSATGYAAVMDGILNIGTVSETPSMAAVNALALGGHRLLSNCADPDCNNQVCFTGLQHVYEPMRDGELAYWCEQVKEGGR